MAVIQPGMSIPQVQQQYGQYGQQGQGYGGALGSQQYPDPKIFTPGKTTVKYPGTQAGKLWQETTRGDVDAARESERRAILNQQKQADAATGARDKTFESSGYQQYVEGINNIDPTYDKAYRERVETLKPTYNQETMDTLKGQSRDILEGQTQDIKRRIYEGTGRPSGFQRQQGQMADVAKEGQFARQSSQLQERKELQDRTDEVQKIGMLADIGKVDRGDALEELAQQYQRAVFDYGVESDLADRIERIYSVTIAKTPEYDWDEIGDITDKMAEQQEYTVETDYSGEAGGEEGGGESGAGGGGAPSGFDWTFGEDWAGRPVAEQKQKWENTAQAWGRDRGGAADTVDWKRKNPFEPR